MQLRSETITVNGNTFVSYSRRQLYFAEALTLHLQDNGINAWFDLQQLQAGSVWSEKLDDGIHTADQLILVVSKASLESNYTRAEWKHVVDEGKSLVLAIYEPVDLPQELRGLPTYDFRNRFNKKLRQLVAFLKNEAKPRHDRVPKPGISFKLPAAIWLPLIILLGPALACLSCLPGQENVKSTFFWIVFGVSVGIGTMYAIPLWRHRIGYGRLKRGALASLVLQIITFFTIGALARDSSFFFPVGAIAIASILTYFVVLRRSADLLRWLQPENDLQTLRRKVHQPLISKVTPGSENDDEAPARQLRVAIHADAADKPFAGHVEKIFGRAGHTVVDAGDGPQQHIGIITNRSSQAWVRKLTDEFATRLVFVIGSSIELKRSLSETERYQWVDFRDGDPQDITMLALSLADHEAAKRETALEATPAKINKWALPPGIKLLKRVLQIYCTYLLVFGFVGLLGVPLVWLPILTPDEPISFVQPFIVAALGGTLYWLINSGIVYRKIPAPIIYVMFALVIGITNWREHSVFPRILKSPSVPLAVFPFILLSLRDARHWFPAFAKVNRDQVGVEESIQKTVRRWNIVAAAIGISLFLLVALIGYLNLPSQSE